MWRNGGAVLLMRQLSDDVCKQCFYQFLLEDTPVLYNGAATHLGSLSGVLLALRELACLVGRHPLTEFLLKGSEILHQ